eukprot:scaffold163484_cov50-Prasinocladus_malaysianus.AAC.1
MRVFRLSSGNTSDLVRGLPFPDVWCDPKLMRGSFGKSGRLMPDAMNDFASARRRGGFACVTQRNKADDCHM